MPNRVRDYFFNDLKYKPYALLGFTGFVFGVISFVPMKLEALDIPLHDFYFVITNISIFGVIATALLFLWSVYVAANRLSFSKKLTWIHVAGTLIPIIFLMIPIDYRRVMSGIPRRYYSITDFNSHESFINKDLIYASMTLITLTAQLIFVINLIIGTVRFFRTRKQKPPLELL